MKHAPSLTHEQLYVALRDDELDPESFDHESHIRLAWYYLNKWPYDEACEKFNTDFLRFIVNAGAQAKYHKTITDALLQLIASHLGDRQCQQSWEYFKKDAEPLFTDAYGLLQRFYSQQLLGSDRAREIFVPADVNVLPEPFKE